MASPAPSISSLSPNHYTDTAKADVRYRTNDLLPPDISFSTDAVETRQFHGTFLLPLPDKLVIPLKANDEIELDIKFYSQGFPIGLVKATILYIQYISNTRTGKLGDEWTPYTGSHDHGSKQKQAAFIAFEATLPKFPVEILWVSIISMRNTGAPCFIHPFPTSFDGDAILLYSILFPPGISPHLALQLGDGFHKFILTYLLSVLPAQQADINKFVSNLFCLMSPSITKHMGAGRLCILATDEPSPEILHYMRQLSFRIPAWTGNPALTGSIPTAETTIDTGGHLPSPTTMRNPDYLQPTLATYFFTGNQAYQVIVDHLKLSLSSLFPKSTPPAWISHLSYSTPHGTIHVIISQLPPGFTPSPARARGDMIPITSDLRIPCIQVLLRPDIAYFYHLPIASVGGFYTHMPLGDCTSPSAALLSHYLGRPPLEALYLLTIHDCASVAANMLNDPLIPLLPSPSAQPIPTAALDDTQPTPKRRGRPSLFRPTPAPLDPAASYKSRPTALLLSPPTSTPSSNSSQAVSVETITRIEAQLATAFARIHSLEQLV